jgi:predicted amidophosphoribosyltransferase
VAGVVWAAVLGPIGWIVVALGKSKLPLCPECGKGNHTGAKSCRHCGVDLRKAVRRTARSRLKGADSDVRW